MVSESLSLPVASTADFQNLLAFGGFDVASMGEPWSTEEVSWQAFLCRKRGGIVSVSIAVMLDRSEPPFVTISTMRKVFGLWLRPRDRRLVREVASYLRDKSRARPAASSDRTT